MLDISLLGSFQLTYNGQEIHLVSRDRYKTLLAYLILHHDVPQARRYVAMRFWPESSEHQALTNLRKLLVDLRKSFPELENFISTDHGTFTWQVGAQVTFDVVEFKKALERAERATDEATAQSELLHAISLYKGDLMPQLYDDWILVERNRLRDAMIGALERLILLYERQRNFSAAIDLLHQLARLDPLREETYRWLMQVQSLNGDRDGVVRSFRICKDLLARELDIEPSQPTRKLYEQLLQKDADLAPMQPASVNQISTPLVNRKQEWAQLEAAWQGALRRSPHCILISGEAGIGKTRLLEELMLTVSRHGYRTLYARARELNHEIPFAPVVEWLRTSWLYSKLHLLKPLWYNEIARLLPELLAVRPEATVALHPLESSSRLHFYEALSHAFLDGDRPILLVLDDLQACDPETLKWLHSLMQANTRPQLLLVVAVRIEDISEDHPVVTWKLALRRERLLTELQLKHLDREYTTLLGEVTAGMTLTEEAQAQLYRETEGNPLFIIEAMQSGFSQNTQHWLQPFPSSTIQAAFELRVMRLSRFARAVAGLAATIGRSFTTTTLVEASGQDEGTLVTALDELLRRRIIREQGPDTYEFSHDKLREVSYAQLSPATQRFNQRRVAMTLASASQVQSIDGPELDLPL